MLASPQQASGETSTSTAGAGLAEGDAAAASLRPSSAEEGLERIPWKEDGYLSWEYDGHKINYVDEGDKNKVRSEPGYPNTIRGLRFSLVLPGGRQTDTMCYSVIPGVTRPAF